MTDSAIDRQMTDEDYGRVGTDIQRRIGVKTSRREPLARFTTMRVGGAHLAKRYDVPVLIKGGHLSGESASDLLFSQLDVFEFSAPFTRGVATHGTGCTYSAAITAHLASGLSLVNAIQRAKSYVSSAIANHFRWNAEGREPIDALNHTPD